MDELGPLAGQPVLMMTVTKNPPAGSVLYKRVNAIIAAAEVDRYAGTDSEDPVVRRCAAGYVLAMEPRLWMHPRSFVRDNVLVPLLGEEACAKARPGALDTLTDVLVEREWLTSSQADRNEPKQPLKEQIAEWVIYEAFFSGFRPDARPWARFEATARELGIGRHNVARVIKQLLCRARGADLAAVWNCIGSSNKVVRDLCGIKRAA